MTEIVQHLELSMPQARTLARLLRGRMVDRTVFLNLESNGDLIVSTPIKENPYLISTVKPDGRVA